MVKNSNRPMLSSSRISRHPAWGLSMGKSLEDNQSLLGISILSALSIAGLTSAINPSVFTLLTFASKPEARSRAMTGLWIGLAASTLASASLWMVFKEPLPALVSEITAAALFGVGVWAVHQPPTTTIDSIEKQPEAQLPGPVPQGTVRQNLMV